MKSLVLDVQQYLLLLLPPPPPPLAWPPLPLLVSFPGGQSHRLLSVPFANLGKAWCPHKTPSPPHFLHSSGLLTPAAPLTPLLLFAASSSVLCHLSSEFHWTVYLISISAAYQIHHSTSLVSSMPLTQLLKQSSHLSFPAWSPALFIQKEALYSILTYASLLLPVHCHTSACLDSVVRLSSSPLKCLAQAGLTDLNGSSCPVSIQITT
jgi:hypothetical protein